MMPIPMGGKFVQSPCLGEHEGRAISIRQRNPIGGKVHEPVFSTSIINKVAVAPRYGGA